MLAVIVLVAELRNISDEFAKKPVIRSAITGSIRASHASGESTEETAHRQLIAYCRRRCCE